MNRGTGGVYYRHITIFSPEGRFYQVAAARAPVNKSRSEAVKFQTKSQKFWPSARCCPLTARWGLPSNWPTQQLPVLQRPRWPSTLCHVSTETEPSAPEPPSSPTPGGEPPEEGPNLTESLASLGILAFWGAWLAYGTLAAPNQTPTIDQYYLEKLFGLHSDDGFVVNSVVFSLWNMMGLWPLVYAMLLIPASRTDRTKVPAWPFSLLSVAFGAFALLPYFALWSAGRASIPSSEERNSFVLKVWESKITASVLLLAALGLIASAATAPFVDWVEFNQIFRQSRLFHVTTSDFAVLALSAPFWMYNDMAYRKWEPRSSWGLGLLLFPMLGPFLYLVLRPGLPTATSKTEA